MGGRPDSFVPLYVADYYKDTRHLSAAEHGAYLLLIFHYWNTGVPLLDDDVVLARIACMPPTEWKRSKAVVRAFFLPALIDGDHVLTHKRIEKELTKANARYDHRKVASEAGVLARQAKRDAIRDANRTVDRTVEPIVTPGVQPGTNRIVNQLTTHNSQSANAESSIQRERAQTLLSRLCEILRIRLEDDPERITWQRQIEEAFRDGLTETELIKATETARTNGKISFPYIRAVAMKPTKTPEEKVNGSGPNRSKKPSATDSHLAGIASLVEEIRGERSG